MTGTLQVKKNRPYYYVLIRYKDEANGKERQSWITTDILVKGNNKRKADEKLKEILAEFKQQKIDLSKDILFTDFIKCWLENTQYSIQASTYDAYKINVYKSILPFFEPKKLKVKDITPMHIQQYIAFRLKTVSPNTVRKHLVNLSKCFDSAVNQNIIAFNPVKRIEMPKKSKFTGAKFYNEAEIDNLLKCAKGDPLEIVVLLTVFYGLRRSEVLGLKWNSIDFENDTLTIKHTITRIDKVVHKTDTTKNDSSYATLPLPNFIKIRLKEWKQQQHQNSLLQPNDYIDEDYVCTQVDGSLIKPDYVTKHFNRLLKNNKLPIIRFHDLRHSSASYLFSLGFNLKEIQTWLRHSDIQTTMNIYTHIDMTAKRNIANDLNDRFENFGS